MAPGEIVAPEAEEVPFSRMVNREMHRAGSCRPCLHLGKQGCDVSLFGSDPWELLRRCDEVFFPNVIFRSDLEHAESFQITGVVGRIFFLGGGHLEGKFHSRWRLQFIWTINLNHPVPNQPGISLDALGKVVLYFPDVSSRLVKCDNLATLRIIGPSYV